jgi:ring-1,2-phenylacetyl-CoA epoxidase subunit PaaC
MSDTPLFVYTLRLADSALVLGHRLSEWSGRGPTLEEDIALSNMGLDLIGQARMLYDYAGRLEAKGRDEDALAYLRDASAYRNVLLAEQPNGDFAVTMVRQLMFAAFAHPLYAALRASKDEMLAGIAAKAEKEMAYHVRHAGEWVIRLGDGTSDSHARAQSAVDQLAIYVAELFEVDAVDRAMIEAGIAPDPSHIKPSFDATLMRVFDEATLALPAVVDPQTGGRDGRHSENLARLLTEMQSLHRAHPGATW